MYSRCVVAASGARMRERPTSRLVTRLTLAVLSLVVACSSDSPTSVLDRASAAVPGAEIVSDLTASPSSASAVTLAWTGVSDGAGAPAIYRVEYAELPGAWTAPADGCGAGIGGTAIGAPVSCTVTGLDAESDYVFRVLSYGRAAESAQPTRYSNVATARTGEPRAGTVTDLTVGASTASSITLRWTQVEDGLGQPASYRLKFGAPPLQWSAGTIGCASTLPGTAVGAPMSCTIEGLPPSTSFDVQLMSFRLRNDVWEGAQPSNVASGATAASDAAAGQVAGIWVDRAHLMQLPTAGAAWDRVLADAAADPGRANIADQDSNHDVYTLAAALACVRAGQHCAKARAGVMDAMGTEAGARWLAVGRNLGAYVIAADLLNLRSDGNSSSDGSTVQRWIEGWLTKRLLDNNSSELRRVEPFATSANASAQEGFAFLTVAAYLRDRSAMERGWNAFRTFACDPTATDVEHIDLIRPVQDGWAHDDDAPCAVNPAGARKTVPMGLPGAGRSYRIDGALIGDMRRGGVFQWEPRYTSYPWVGLEGFVPAAVVLHRAGYPAFQVANEAVLRTHDYLWELRKETGDADWFDGTRSREIVHLVNAVYGASFPVNDVAGAGRTVGYTSWTHATWE